MIDIGVRLFAAWLAHPEHGVNAIAATIPRATFGSAAVDDAPPAVTIVNDADDGNVVFSPEALPALAVWGDSAADTEARGHQIAKEVVVVADFLTEDGADERTSVRSCGYVMRAVRISMLRYNHASKSEGYRELNGVRVLKINHTEEQRAVMTSGRVKLWGRLAIYATLAESLT